MIRRDDCGVCDGSKTDKGCGCGEDAPDSTACASVDCAVQEIAAGVPAQFRSTRSRFVWLQGLEDAIAPPRRTISALSRGTTLNNAKQSETKGAEAKSADPVL